LDFGEGNKNEGVAKEAGMGFDGDRKGWVK
jgi:hypothetical protein